MFLRIISEIRSALDERNGLQVCVLHKDQSFQNNLPRLFKELGITRLYVESPRDAFDNLEKNINKVKPDIVKYEITVAEARDGKLLKMPDGDSDGLSYVIAFAIIEGITVILIDVPTFESAKVLPIIHGTVAATKEQQEEAFKTRLTHDDSMVASVKTNLADCKEATKYIVLTGSMHSG